MRMTISQRVRLGTAAAAVALLAVAVAGPAQAAPGREGAASLQAPRRALLLFPMDISSGAAAMPAKDEAAAILTDVAASRLDASGLYSVTRFSKALPTVARLHMDQLLTDSDVQPPFSEDNRKPIKVAREAGYDVAFVGSVDSYEYSDTDKKVTMILSARLLEAQTGKVLKTVIFNVPATGGTGKEDEIALAAARSGGEQLMTRMVPTVAPPVIAPGTQTTPRNQTTAPPRRRARMDWLWGVLAVGLGLGIGLSSSGGGGGGGGAGGGGGDNPPPPPR